MPEVAAGALRHAVATARGRYLRAIGALGLIRDDEGRILLGRTAYAPRLWNLPGGRVEVPERVPHGLRREVREETGLEVAIDRLLVVDSTNPRAVSFVFRCRVTGGVLRPAAGEIRALRWLDPAEVEHLPRRVRLTLEAALKADAAGDIRYRG